MPVKFKLITKILFYSASVIYPLLVFYFLVIQRIQIKQLSFFIIAVALFAFIAGTSTGTSPGASKKKRKILCMAFPASFRHRRYLPVDK
jgi:hypothetical protein